MKIFNNILLLSVSLFGLILTLAAALWLGAHQWRQDSRPLVVSSVEILPASGEDTLRIRLEGQGFSSRTQVALTLDSANRHAIVGSLETLGIPGTLEQVRVLGNRAYLANSRSGIQVVDISDPRRPKVLGVEKEAFRSPWDLKVAGDLAYVSDSRQGLVILDVSDATRPQAIGRFVTPDACFGLAASPAGLVLLAQGKKGVLLLDVSDPRAPREIGRLPSLDFSWTVAVRDHLAFVADNRGGLRIFDLQNAAQPQLLAQLATEGNLLSVVVQEDLVYLADQKRGLIVLDVSDPAKPRNLSELSLAGVGRDLQVHGDTLAFATQTNGVKIVDVSDPRRPRKTGFVQPLRTARGVALSDDFLFVADSRQGLQVAELSRARAGLNVHHSLGDIVTALAQDGPILYAGMQNQGLQSFQRDAEDTLVSRGTFGKSFSAVRDGAVAGDSLFLAADNDGLQILDLGEEGQMRRIGHLVAGGVAHRVVLLDEGRIAVVAAGLDGIQVIDVARPRQPTLIHRLGGLGNLVDLLVWPGGMAALDATGQVHLLDIADPRQPRLGASVSLPDILRGLELYKETLYVFGEGNHLYLIDIRAPRTSLKKVALAAGTKPLCLRISGDHLYLLAKSADRNSQLLIFDLGRQGVPLLVKSIALPGLQEVFRIFGETLYLSRSSTLQVWDIAEPAEPREVNAMAIGGRTRDLVSLGSGNLKLLLGDVGIRRLDVSDPHAPRLVRTSVDNISEVIGLEVRGEHLLVLDRTSGLHVLTRDDSGGLLPLSTLGFPQNLRNWHVDATHAHVLDAGGRLSVVDIRRPESLQLAAEIDLGTADVNGLVVRDHLVYLAAGDAGVQVWDIRLAEHPRLLQQHQLPWPRSVFALTRDLVLVDDHLLVANGDAGLGVFALRDAGEKLHLVGSLPLAGFCRRIKVQDSLLLIEAHQAGLHVVDIREIKRPEWVVTVPTRTVVRDFFFEGEDLWLAEHAGISILSLPIKSKRQSVRGRKNLVVDLPVPARPGNYNLSVRRGPQSVELPGILTLSAPTEAGGVLSVVFQKE